MPKTLYNVQKQINKKMKKLKLNKQTISLLENKDQKKVMGGNVTIENLCKVTGHTPCNPGTIYATDCGSCNFTCGYICYQNKIKKEKILSIRKYG